MIVDMKGREGGLWLMIMKIRILYWNVRGENDCDKRKAIKAVIKDQKVDLVCLQESKFQTFRRCLLG